MASFSITFPSKTSFLSVFAAFICFLSVSHAREQTKASSSHFINAHVNSVPPHEDLICTQSSRGKNKQGVSLELVHRHGPCSKLKSVAPSRSDLLQRDQDRVDYIHARISGRTILAGQGKFLNLPPHYYYASNEYTVYVGLGTPPKNLTLEIDTGSALTWTQCKPCRKCYHQEDAMFEPAKSSSYANVSCASMVCAERGMETVCSWATSTWQYEMGYADGSVTAGSLAKERISLSSTHYIDGFLFGCGENSHGTFDGEAGIIGLSRGNASLMSQAASKYGKYFSYCLPSEYSNSPGHLTLGPGGTKARSFRYTPLVTRTGDEDFYCVNLESMSINGNRLPISTTMFSEVRSILDSGTVITRLPPQAYSVLRDAFKRSMWQYPWAGADGIVDTCYYLSGINVTVPKVALNFGGGCVLDLSVENVLEPPPARAKKGEKVCLMFAANRDPSHHAVVGNYQQRGFDVVHDVAGGRIGFGPNGC